MSEENRPITVRVDPALRPKLRRYARLLKRAEGQILAMAFEDLAAMADQRGEEKLPHLVHLARAAEEYEAAQPSLSLTKERRMDTTRSEPYKTSKPNRGLVSETPKNCKKI